MKKFIKFIKIVLLSLITLVLCAYVVFYAVKPDQAKEILDKVMEYANRPLPIVGVSVTVFSVLVWKVFSATIYGKKRISEMKAEYQAEKTLLKNDYESKKTEYATMIGYFNEEIDIMYNSLSKVCSSSPNKKIKEIGVNLSGELAVIRKDLRNKFDEVKTTDAESLIKSRKEIVDSIVEIVKQELEKKYGKEGKKVANIVTEEKKI